MEDFSAVLITKNESKTLPRLLKSLTGVTDIVILDTGSVDDTVKIAKDAGCNVIEVGDKFLYLTTQEQYDKFKTLYGYEPFFKPGEKYFHYSDARNYASTFAKNDWVFQPDADEVVEWDIKKVRENLTNNDHFVYRFCYQHRPDGSCGLEFTHSKFYRKSKIHWHHRVHEVHIPIEGQNPKPPFFCDFIYHHHYQLQTDNRKNYPCNLELSVVDDPNNDRNVYYLGREYFWMGAYEKAIPMLKKGIELSQWNPEKGQAQIFLAQSYERLGKEKEAIETFYKAIETCDSRREPFFALADYFDRNNNLDRALIYYLAAYAIEFYPQGYLNDMQLYGEMIPSRIALIYGKKRNEKRAKEWWLKALDENPNMALHINESISLAKMFRNYGLEDNKMRVLNVGIGQGTSGFSIQIPIFYFQSLTHVEIHRPYIEEARKIATNSKSTNFIESDIRLIQDFTPYNTVFCFDLLEHLPKNDSLALLLKWMDKNVFVFIPIEKDFMKNDTGVQSQEHQSYWTEEDFKKLGFKTTLLKNFHKIDGKTFDALWAIRINAIE